jgi:hypothetical protein
MTEERKKFIVKLETLLMRLVVLKGLKLNIDGKKYNFINPDGSQYLRIYLYDDCEGMINIEAFKAAADKLTPSRRVFIESSLAHFTEFLPTSEFNLILTKEKLLVSFNFRLSLKLKKIEEYFLITKLWDLVDETRQINELLNLDMHLQKAIKLN